MSLCILLRTPDGGALMSADTAVSTTYEGVSYRVQNEEDNEKVIIHLEHMIFCSGILDRRRALRSYIRSQTEIDYDGISKFAQQLWGDEKNDQSTGILICQPDNKLIGMLSAQSFKVRELPWNQNTLDIHALGFHMQEAYNAACRAAQTAKDWSGMVLAAYRATACEEVGGKLHVFSRKAGEKIKRIVIPAPEATNIRKGVFVPLSKPVLAYHAIVQASDFLDHSGTSLLTGEGKLKGEYIDARGITIKDAQGNDVVYFDETGIHWASQYSPIKYQFSTSLSGPWHGTMQTNDKYRRDSLDGGTTWGAPYQFVGVDGKDGSDGSDANIPKYITQTIISKGVIEAPQINANDFAIYPNNPSDTTGSFTINGMYNGTQHEMFKLTYQDASYPIVTMRGAHLEIHNKPTDFYGPVNFYGDVTGVTAEFK